MGVCIHMDLIMAIGIQLWVSATAVLVGFILVGRGTICIMGIVCIISYRIVCGIVCVMGIVCIISYCGLVELQYYHGIRLMGSIHWDRFFELYSMGSIHITIWVLSIGTDSMSSILWVLSILW